MNEQISIALGTDADGKPIFAHVSSSHPLTRAFLRRLARYLEFMAQEWEEEPCPNPENA